MVLLSINLKNVSLVLAEKNNQKHRYGVWKVFNENLKFFHETQEPISYRDHCKWWENAFDNEYIYVALYKNQVCGYIRITKRKTNSKEKHEISIALSTNIPYLIVLCSGKMKKTGIT